MNYYIDVIKKYVQFSGRARRKEYWMFALISGIISIIINFIDNALGTSFTVNGVAIGIIGLIYSLFILLPSWALCVRRLHDIDKSGWFLLLGLIPFVGAIILLVYACKAGTVGENKYGADPKSE